MTKSTEANQRDEAWKSEPSSLRTKEWVPVRAKQTPSRDREDEVGVDLDAFSLLDDDVTLKEEEEWCGMWLPFLMVVFLGSFLPHWISSCWEKKEQRLSLLFFRFWSLEDWFPVSIGNPFEYQHRWEIEEFQPTSSQDSTPFDTKKKEIKQG